MNGKINKNWYRAISLSSATAFFVWLTCFASAGDKAVESVATWIEKELYYTYFGYDPTVRKSLPDLILKWDKSPVISLSFEGESTSSLGKIQDDLRRTAVLFRKFGIDLVFSDNKPTVRLFIFSSIPDRSSHLGRAISIYTENNLELEETIWGAVEELGCYVALSTSDQPVIVSAMVIVRVDNNVSQTSNCIRKSLLGVFGFAGVTLQAEEASVFNDFREATLSSTRLDELVFQLLLDKRIESGTAVRDRQNLIRMVARQIAAEAEDVEALSIDLNR